MSLGNLLLQPQRIQRQSDGESETELGQDILRLAILLAEDAVDEGPLVGVGPQLVENLSNRFQTQTESGMESVFAALKAKFQPLFVYFDQLVSDVAVLEDDASVLLDIVAGIVAALRSVLDGVTQARIKVQLDFMKGLLEQNLGVDPEFVNQQIIDLLNDLILLWQQLPSDLAPEKRRRRQLAIAILKRVQNRLLDDFTLPEIDTARASVALYNLFKSSEIDEIFAEIECVLGKFEEAVDAVNELRSGLPFNLQSDSVGAALIEPEGAARYCWYASWLLSDVDLPLLSVSDVEDSGALVNLFRTHQSANSQAAVVTRYLFSEMSEAQQQLILDFDGTSEPDESLMLMLVAHINRVIQEGPLYTIERFRTVPDNPVPQTPITVPFEFSLQPSESISRDDMPEDLQELMDDYLEDQELFLFNRRFLEWVYGEDLLCEYTGTFWRFVRRNTIGIKRDIIISGDKRYLLCGDMPLYAVEEGVELKWQDAPLFIDTDSNKQATPGAQYYTFKRVSADACDIIAQTLFSLEQTVRPVWHLVKLQPGHEIGTGIVSGLDILHALNEILLGKPISGYESLGGFGSWLANDFYGPRGLALFGGSFQGLHTEATAGNGFWFWLTVVLGDFIRNNSHNTILQIGRDFILTFFTLLNSSESNSGGTSPGSNPADNHLKQAGIISPVNTVFAYLLIRIYQREDHSIFIWTKDGIGERRKRAFALWFGGGIGFGLLSGFTGSLLSNFIAWQTNWKQLGFTLIGSSVYMLLGFWFFEYFFKEGDTGDGTLAPLAKYKGYPAQATSPYKLPFDDEVALYMGQGNNGLFSHNEIANIGANWQIYSFDLGHDHRQIVRAMRGGVVENFVEGFADNTEMSGNFIVIKHSNLVPDHDDPFGTGTPVQTYAVYFHAAQNGITNVLGTSPVGTAVVQGDPIMEADDTGTSFHSHLHIYVVMDDAGSRGSDSIPFVFSNVNNSSGVMESLTWYRSEED